MVDFININTNHQMGAQVNIYLPIIGDRLGYITSAHQQILNLLANRNPIAIESVLR